MAALLSPSLQKTKQQLLYITIMTAKQQIKYGRLIPVMLCFFAMGFVDLVGIASNYVKADLGLSLIHI